MRSLGINIGFAVILTLCSLMVSAGEWLGSPAPAFSLPDQDGKTHQLQDYKGKWLVLYFYPKDHTSGCTEEAKRFRDQFTNYQKQGIVVAGVSLDSVESLDILPQLKQGDSSCETLMSERENVHRGVYVAVVSDSALTTCPFSYSKSCSTFRTVTA